MTGSALYLAVIGLLRLGLGAITRNAAGAPSRLLNPPPDGWVAAGQANVLRSAGRASW